MRQKFHDFHDQTPVCKNFSRENFFLQKFLADDGLKKLSTFSPRKLTHFVIETSPQAHLVRYFGEIDMHIETRNRELILFGLIYSLRRSFEIDWRIFLLVFTFRRASDDEKVIGAFSSM